MDVSILTATPIVLGVLTCLEEEQAVKRSTGDNNHGVDWGEWARVSDPYAAGCASSPTLFFRCLGVGFCSSRYVLFFFTEAYDG